jgi:hypothetical protein
MGDDFMPSETAAWARNVNCYEEIPSFFQNYVSKAEPFPYLVYSPQDQWGQRATNAKLTCVYRDRIVFLEKLQDRVHEASYFYQDINYIEQGSVLLYSWITINGLIDGKLSTATVEYNAVVGYLFMSVIKAFRESRLFPGGNTGEQELFKLDFLKSANYKFLNYSRESVLPGEKIVRVVYQQEEYEKFLLFFSKTRISAHVTILTDKEIIIIKDEENRSFMPQRQAKYGGTRTYIPLKRICKLNLETSEEKQVITLVIEFIYNTAKLLFSLVQKKELTPLICEFNEFSKKND